LSVVLTQRMHYCAERRSLTGIRPQSACSSCRQSSACGSALLSKLQHSRAELALPLTPADAPEHGAEFVVSLPAKSLLRICAVVFPGLSLLLLGGASLFGQLFAEWGEAACAVGALSGLVVGVLLLRLYDSRFGSRGSAHRLLIVPSGRVFDSDS
jgi:positive regulator of sigma E activity